MKRKSFKECWKIGLLRGTNWYQPDDRLVIEHVESEVPRTHSSEDWLKGMCIYDYGAH